MQSICAVYGRDNAAGRVLQLAKRRERDADHRGNVVKVVFTDGKELHQVVRDLDSIRTLETIGGLAAVAHVGPENTRGKPNVFIDPIVMNTNGAAAAFALQGFIRNYDDLKNRLLKECAVFSVESKGMTASQADVVHHLAQRGKGPLEDRVISAMGQLHGSLGLVGMGPDKMVVAQNSLLTPLFMGTRKGGYYFCSEPAAFEALGVADEDIEEIPENELLCLRGLASPSLKKIRKGPENSYRCPFLSRHDPFSQALYLKRTYGKVMQQLGEELARVSPIEPGDDVIVVPIPDSGNDIALGFSRASGIPFQLALRRSHQTFRSHADDAKFHRISVVPDLLKLRVVLGDDRLYTAGTLCRENARMRRHGVREVHIRLAYDPTVAACDYGVSDVPESALWANVLGMDGFDEKRFCFELSSKGSLAKKLRIPGEFEGPNSCKSLALEKHWPIIGKREGYCTRCFDGKRPGFDTYEPTA